MQHTVKFAAKSQRLDECEFVVFAQLFDCALRSSTVGEQHD